MHKKPTALREPVNYTQHGLSLAPGVTRIVNRTILSSLPPFTYLMQAWGL